MHQRSPLTTPCRLGYPVCGIAGIVGREDRQLARRMADRIAHRGPDGEGVWIGDGVSLAHRRLAILDPSHGQQPMVDVSGRFTIVYNGECYNHLDIRQELTKLGHRFETTTDTETVLAGFSQWGAAIVARMEGMFAFAIWDSTTKTLFAARDPFGIKPFFYAAVGDSWLFGSEMKALLADELLPAIADVDRLKERGILEFLTGQSTLLQGFHQLPPGTTATFEAGKSPAIVPYYVIANLAFANPADAAKTIAKRMEDSVREQLLADVPLGVILSGGFDSAVVAAIHQGIEKNPISTFTIAEDENVEDFTAARRVAQHLGTVHHETFFDSETVWQDMWRFTLHNENINYTEFFFLPLFEMMRKHVKVGLCGQGSDEMWAGYTRYRQPLPLAVRRLEKLRQSAPSHADALSAEITMNHLSGAHLAAWDQQGQLANFQLRLVDRNSMAHSVEVRVPFLSRPLHQASHATPWAWKIQGDVEKWILRKALEKVNLPQDLIWRPKVPAGRATAPRVIGEFEQEAARLLGDAKSPLGTALETPAEILIHRMWEEIFIHNRGEARPIRLEDLA